MTDFQERLDAMVREKIASLGSIGFDIAVPIESVALDLLARVDALEGGPRWIKCSERMPEDMDENVLAGTPCIYPSPSGERLLMNCEVMTGYQFEDWNITHWMPLPPPPRDEPEVR